MKQVRFLVTAIVEDDTDADELKELGEWMLDQLTIEAAGGMPGCVDSFETCRPG